MEFLFLKNFCLNEVKCMCLLKKCDVADELTVNSVVFPKPPKSKRLALSASSSFEGLRRREKKDLI